MQCNFRLIYYKCYAIFNYSKDPTTFIKSIFLQKDLIHIIKLSRVKPFMISFQHFYFSDVPKHTINNTITYILHLFSPCTDFYFILPPTVVLIKKNPFSKFFVFLMYVFMYNSVSVSPNNSCSPFGNKN